MGIKQSTLKELWGASKNKCAHPGCEEEIVDLDHGIIVGEMCHIRAQSPGGPRYNPELDDEDIHSFSNLILLCPTHHTHVDKNPSNYTVEDLQRWKENQTVSSSESQELSEELMERLVEESGDISVEEGSFIITNNQMGGQVAHEITNVGPQPRSIPKASRAAMVNQLRNYNPPKVRVEGLMGDGETLQLAKQILSILEQAGWEVEGPDQVVRTGNPTGIVLMMPEETESMIALGNLLLQSGLKAEGAIDEEGGEFTVIVGANL